MYHCVRRFGTTRATLSKQVSPLPFSNHASLIYHDRGILVLNKPPGIISQLGTGTPDSSVERLLAGEFLYFNCTKSSEARHDDQISDITMICRDLFFQYIAWIRSVVLMGL